MPGNSMQDLRNFIFGAIVAGVCLAPAAWADGQALAAGNSPAPVTTATLFPFSEALASARAALPNVTARALRALGAIAQTPAGSFGNRNGS